MPLIERCWPVRTWRTCLGPSAAPIQQGKQAKHTITHKRYVLENDGTPSWAMVATLHGHRRRLRACPQSDKRQHPFPRWLVIFILSCGHNPVLILVLMWIVLTRNQQLDCIQSQFSARWGRLVGLDYFVDNVCRLINPQRKQKKIRTKLGKPVADYVSKWASHVAPGSFLQSIDRHGIFVCTE